MRHTTTKETQMKFYIQQVRVRGFEMFEAVSQEGDVIAQAWSEAGAISAAKKIRTTNSVIDTYDYAQMIAQHGTR